MPAHLLHPRHNPPTIRERLLLHTSDVWLCLTAIGLGVVVILAPLWQDGAPASMSLAEVSNNLAVTLAAVIIAGGVTALTGLLWVGRTVSHGWTLEQVGHWLLAGAWLGYTYAVFQAYPHSLAVYAVSGVLSLAAATRALVVLTIERRTRADTDRPPGTP